LGTSRAPAIQFGLRLALKSEGVNGLLSHVFTIAAIILVNEWSQLVDHIQASGRYSS
jgi:hypothetical protein